MSRFFKYTWQKINFNRLFPKDRMVQTRRAGMDVYVKATDDNRLDTQRMRWSLDPAVRRFVALQTEDDTPTDRPVFIRYFEIYQKKRRVGDIRIFGDKNDEKRNMAQLLIVLGEKRGLGIGTRAVSLVLDQLRDVYRGIYCRVNRYNLASIRMLRRNGFVFRNLVGNEFILERRF